MFDQDPTRYSTVGAIAGAIGMKIIDKVFRWKSRKLDDAQQLRKELREEVGHLNNRISELYKDLDFWKEKYYKLAQENLYLREECQSLRTSVEQLRTTKG